MQEIVIPVGKLLPPALEMRDVMTMEGLDELADSVRKHGLLQPLLVRPEGDSYRIIAGARRFEVLKRLQIDEARCTVVSADSRQSEEMKIHENLKREDVDPVEEADYYMRLYHDEGWSVDDLVRATGRSLGYVEGRLEMAGWPEAVKGALKAKAVTIAVARELVKFRDEEVRHRFLHSAAAFGAPSNVVKGWREKWEADERAESARAAGGPAASARDVSPAPPILCALCGEDTTGMIVEYLPVTRRCAQEIAFIRVETEKRRADAARAREGGQG
jgi:ParB/RepB/Spo0J family partition protein